MPTNDEVHPQRPLTIEQTISTSLGALVAQIAVQAVLGVTLATIYKADANDAFRSIGAIPSILRSFHFWGSAVLIVHAMGHVALTTWYGLYRKPFEIAYWLSLAVAGLAMAIQVSGNLLPFDRHAVQSANTEAAIGAQLPALGNLTTHAMLDGPTFSDSTLKLWYGAHWVIGVSMVVVAVLAFVVGRRIAPPRRFQAAIPSVLALVVAAVIPAPLGTAATSRDYGMFNALPGWYVWPLHGANVVSTLLFHTGWVGTALLPGLFALFILALPILGTRLGTRAVRSVFGAFVLLFAFAAVGYGGQVAPLTGNRDPANATTSTSPAIANPGQNAVLAARGRNLFASVGCSNCHGTDGLQAKFGPSLTSVYKEHPDLAFYQKYIHDPKSMQADSAMPAFPDLKQEELRALAEFLRFPRGSGQ